MEILLLMSPLAYQDSHLRDPVNFLTTSSTIFSSQAHGSILVTMATVTEMAHYILCKGQPSASDSKLTAFRQVLFSLVSLNSYSQTEGFNSILLWRALLKSSGIQIYLPQFTTSNLVARKKLENLVGEYSLYYATNLQDC